MNDPDDSRTNHLSRPNSIRQLVESFTRVSTVRRHRSYVLLSLFGVIAAGLASRRYSWLFPRFLHDYPGDAFWAMAAYLGLLLIRPAISLRSAAAGGLAISFGVELSQFYHDTWIDGIRRTPFGRLLLGSGFDWLDLVAYGVGVGIVSMFDAWVVIPVSTHTERIEK